ncbi:MAG: hypothetical protein SV487_10455 [Thermodesulfobacteriota bacterium]|nr:hypothetical protein [Thermodesulfobacteriota bacterium]
MVGMKNKVSLVLAASFLVWALTLSPGRAAAGCGWPKVLDGSLNSSSHLHTARTMSIDEARSELMRKHQALTLCLSSQVFVQYYASVSLVLGRFGRKFCGWPLVGHGSANPNEHLLAARALGKTGVTRELAHRFKTLSECLDRDWFCRLYAAVSLVQAEYGTGQR